MLTLARIIFVIATIADVLLTQDRLSAGRGTERNLALSWAGRYAWLVSLLVSVAVLVFAHDSFGGLLFGAALHAAAVAIILRNT